MTTFESHSVSLESVNVSMIQIQRDPVLHHLCARLLSKSFVGFAELKNWTFWPIR